MELVMNPQEILDEFEQAGAILKGHFILSSGLRSDTYLQCARVQMNAKRLEKLCKALADKIVIELKNIKFDVIVSPAMGGIVIGYEMGRQLGVESMFCERVDGIFTLKRGFSFPKDAKVLVIEDVVTTGKSSLEAYECIKQNGGIVVAEASLINRTNGKVNLGVPLVSLLTLDIDAYEPDKLPDHLKNIPAIKPGSRPTIK